MYINSFFATRRGLSSDILPRFFLHGTEFRVVFSSAEWFGTEFRDYASIFVPRNEIPSCFLFRGRVRNGIPRGSVPRNSWNSVGKKQLFRLFCLPRNYFFVGNSQPYPQGTVVSGSNLGWVPLKVPKFEIFNRSDFHHFYYIKPF